MYVIYSSVSTHSQASNTSSKYEYYYNNDAANEDETVMVENKINNTSLEELEDVYNTQAPPLDTDPDSITVLVNKNLGLANDFVPSHLVIPDILFEINYYDEKKLMKRDASNALEELFKSSEDSGLNLYAISGYRSYARQNSIYKENISTKGELLTNQYSAKPGFSEHQTGLCMDVSTPSICNRLEDVFEGTPEGKWLAENAHLYGFIIRYPKDKESITGYSYEPWHIRFVGTKLAQYLYTNDLTLEEYYNQAPSTNTSDPLIHDSGEEDSTSAEEPK